MPNALWCGDLTEIVTDEGTLYLATVLDLFSRRSLGYAMSEHHDADVAIAALNMAAANRGGTVEGVIFHSDRGSEYCADAFACRTLGVVQSMSRVGSAMDNAAEAFNSILKVEYVHRHHFRTRSEARLKIAPGSSASITPDAAAAPATASIHRLRTIHHRRPPGICSITEPSTLTGDWHL